MDEGSLRFLEEILTGNSPSGFEFAQQNLWLERTRKFAEKSAKDVHGNAMAAINPDHPFKVMFAGHMDEIGLMVMNIAADGTLEICY